MAGMTTNPQKKIIEKDKEEVGVIRSSLGYWKEFLEKLSDLIKSDASEIVNRNTKHVCIPV